ncbi:hypothetical protein HDU76_005920 [Blyttiomyces sp. JEL0837]|nr:hypothetical protein HDU76_005920 [Blyttiomyces sp. JEL0837]
MDYNDHYLQIQQQPTGYNYDDPYGGIPSSPQTVSIDPQVSSQQVKLDACEKGVVALRKEVVVLNKMLVQSREVHVERGVDRSFVHGNVAEKTSQDRQALEILPILSGSSTTAVAPSPISPNQADYSTNTINNPVAAERTKLRNPGPSTTAQIQPVSNILTFSLPSGHHNVAPAPSSHIPPPIETTIAPTPGPISAPVKPNVNAGANVPPIVPPPPMATHTYAPKSAGTAVYKAPAPPKTNVNAGTAHVLPMVPPPPMAAPSCNNETKSAGTTAKAPAPSRKRAPSVSAQFGDAFYGNPGTGSAGTTSNSNYNYNNGSSYGSQTSTTASSTGFKQLSSDADDDLCCWF